ncbi:MAG: BCCT family transporter [Vibrio sp.]
MSREHDDIFKPSGETNPIDTDYILGQDNLLVSVGPFKFDIHNRVFTISGLSIIFFVIATLLFPSQAENLFSSMKGWIVSSLDWFFLISGNIFVLVSIFLIVSPLGKVRIGGTEATSEYGYTAWISMLFAAGMGIGLIFYGVAEPMTHFGTSLEGPLMANGVRNDWAPLAGAAGDMAGAESLGMAASFYHWGIHPWAIYSILALALAVFSFNKGLPLTMRSIFYPILGERVWGWPGHIIDISAVFATVFGLATSLGLGSSQALSGLHSLFGIPQTETAQIILIVIIVSLAMISVVAGLDSGVKRLSEFNMVLAVLALVFVVVAGPTWEIFSGFFDNLGAYVTNFIPLSNPVGREDLGFVQDWTSFYWTWWVACAPFVGMFVARISRGRTVREFLLCAILIPSLVCCFWMTSFGGTAIHQYVVDGYQGVMDADLSLKLFAMFDHMPFSEITSAVGVFLIIVFFITSSDSGSLVIDTLAAGGKVDAPTPQRIFWCIFSGLVAIALMLGGGLEAAQAMTIATGFPFAVLMLFSTFALVKGLMSEPRGEAPKKRASAL